ncbi:MAG: hypothetical protein AWU57_3130 [Marinobacter sp. T13-3]|nr:MAG: hypothetical protein AWU57_3130 [Marinobacter sp. T13-3]
MVLHVHLNGLGFFRFGLLDGQRQQAILEVGFHAVFIDIVRQGEPAQEAAIEALNAMMLLVVGFFLALALALNG